MTTCEEPTHAIMRAILEITRATHTMSRAILAIVRPIFESDGPIHTMVRAIYVIVRVIRAIVQAIHAIVRVILERDVSDPGAAPGHPRDRRAQRRVRALDPDG